MLRFDKPRKPCVFGNYGRSETTDKDGKATASFDDTVDVVLFTHDDHIQHKADCLYLMFLHAAVKYNATMIRTQSNFACMHNYPAIILYNNFL